MKKHAYFLVFALAVTLLAVVAVGVQSQEGQPQTLEHGFERGNPIWIAGPFDAAYKETKHVLTDETAHTGQKSELIQLTAEQGSFIYYTYPIGKASVTEELNISLWVKANRPGMQLRCRVVLPRERDPKNPEQPLTVLLDGDKYSKTGRWDQLAVRQAVKRLREQQQMLNKELKRLVLTDDAYVDRIFLNVYGGPGETTVWTDDLEVSPLLDGPARPDTTTPGTGVPAHPAINARASNVTLKGKELMVNDSRFFMRAIRHTGTPFKALRLAGINTLILDETTPPGLIDDAANLGFWIVPSLAPPDVADARGGPVNAQLTAASSEAFGRKLDPFRRSGAILGYDLGSNIQADHAALVSLEEKVYRNFDSERPLLIDVMDGLNQYAHRPGPLMLGVHRWPLMTGLELTGYRDWLTQRRQVVGPEGLERFWWTWIQTHLDDWYTTLVYDKPGAGGFDEPVGPQPEQIRLLTYCAVGCGYRGVAFWSDRFLADSHAGRDRLLAMAQLNQELKLLEPLLVNCGTPTWIDTSRPEVKAAVFRTEDRKAMLVLPIWLGPGSQFVPAQAAVPELKITVPQAMDSAQAWEVSPGGVQALRMERVVGGVRVTLHEFGLTGAIVFTSDLSPDGLVVHMQARQRGMVEDAARWAHEQAVEELAKVEKVQAELDELNVKLVDEDQLLASSRKFIDECAKARRNGDYREAYADAQRALRPLRILMRAQWDRVDRELYDIPTASPYAVSFFTLARFWKFYQELKRTQPGANLVTDGDFEMAMDRQPSGWLLDNPTPPDAVVTRAQRVTTEAQQGKQALMLEMLPKDPQKPPFALEHSYVAISSPTVKLPPGTPVQVTGWVKIPQKITGSVDGALLFDSAGGEPLAVRLTDKTDWRKIVLYRTVPASGGISVSVVLTGIGRAYFDDLRIEPLVNAATNTKTAAAPH
jgi:hypothetical protein